MFNVEGLNNNESEDFSKLNDEELLALYKKSQEEVAMSAKRVGQTNKGEYVLYGEIPASPEDSKFVEKEINYEEKMMAKLNNLRGEIEKRGLEAPTMEERGI